jgi:cis-3-alkyl-4-acyloxetan-2-one decarboxylase
VRLNRRRLAQPRSSDTRPKLPSNRREVVVRGDRTSLSYVDVGPSAGDPVVVLVHGLGGRWQHWSQVIPSISQERRVIAVDLPGFGDSPPIAKRPALPLFADAVAALLRDLGVERTVFVGHSFGGPLAVTFATRYPGLAARVVLVGGTVQSFQRTLAGQVLPWVTRPRTAVATVAELVATVAHVPQPLQRSVAASALLRRAALWPFVWRPSRLSFDDALLLIEGAGAPGVLAAARAIALSIGWERVRVDVPVALINGDHDFIAPLADLRAYRGRVDQAVIIKGTGHLPMLEAPDAFVAALDTVALRPPGRLT